MLLKDQKVKRPDKTKLFKRGSDKYVYHIEKKYKKDNTKHLAEKRVCIGKMIDNEYLIPNEKFERYYQGIEIEKEFSAPIFSDSVDVGTFSLINSFMASTSIGDILDETFDNKSSLIKDLVAYILIKESCVFEHFPYWARKSLIYSDRIYSDSYISKLLKDEISIKQIEYFLSEWNKLNKDINDVYINVDSTNFNVASDYDGLADFGYAKDDRDKPQINLSYLSRSDNNRPLSYELYNGSINDTGEVNHLLRVFNKFNYSNIGFIFDRGYYSIDLVKYLKKNDYFFIMMLKDNYDYVQEVIDKYKDELVSSVDNYISEYELSYVSKKVNISKNKNDKVFCYVHVFYNSLKAADDKVVFLNTIDTYEKEIQRIYESDKLATKESFTKYTRYFKFTYSKEGYLLSFEKDKTEIKKTMASLGYFALLTSKDMDSKDVISTYRSRDSIEKLFRALKSSFEFDHPGVHYKSSLESKVFITFIAMILRNEISINLRKLSINERKQFTFPYVINELNEIEATKGIDDAYRRRYALTAKQKKILSIYKLKEKDIESSISLLNNKIN